MTTNRALRGPWETLRVEIEDSILLVELDRQERMNAISPTMLSELPMVWDLFEADDSLRVAVITGAGTRAFCSGADVGTVADRSRARTGVFERENRFTPLQAKVSKPTICAVNGVCAGGGLHFVADTDFTIAADTATFLDPHVSVGQVSAVETIVLARRMPHQAVMRMMLLGRDERVDAEHALRLGMVTEVVPAAELRGRAIELARIIAGNSPAAIAVSRACLWDALERPMHDAVRLAWPALRAHGDHHPDAQEGPRAFGEKRPPKWQR
ncbi:enoyl-CoA hydratase/isomerase family protein [Nocardia anaemiae]|uniref:enoyl-CoA hydratase/isomerase family protein n=1 Tax=Nocardia anaemiae TaxID=263910 RepID=UPI0007A50FBE|nr:enoyl-CoA hydratase-related protein [Nocardia anaemiae]